VTLATSPSEQSNSRYSWISTNTPTAAHTPGTPHSTPAATPDSMNATVTELGDQPHRTNSSVANGEKRRM